MDYCYEDLRKPTDDDILLICRVNPEYFKKSKYLQKSYFDIIINKLVNVDNILN
jgi:hypothetical protein